jgi:prepilin-type N-terminal cleavage/methylation domain-containing protein
MKTHCTRRAPQAFSLIELLIVITIIAMLAGLVVSGANSAIRRARDLSCATAARGVNQGIRDYEVDYNRLPITGNVGEQVIELTSGSSLLAVLLGSNEGKLNPQRIRYIEPQQGKSGAGGLVGDEGGYALMDPWGMPFQVVIDADGDGRIANPDQQNSDSKTAADAPATLLTKAIVYSFGADKIAFTKDDVRSWR